MTNYTPQTLARIAELDAKIDAADHNDAAFFNAVAEKDAYIESQGLDRDLLEVTGREVSNYIEQANQPQAPAAFVLPDALTRLTLAEQFYNELSDSVEVFSDIVEQHGARTLSDLFHLHASIMSNGFIDAWPDSAVLDVVSQLPSADRWVAYASVYDENGLEKESIFSTMQAQTVNRESPWELVKMSNYIEHPASGKTGTFAAKYDQHAERNGQNFTVLGAVDPGSYDAAECGELFSIRFSDGVQIEAWPEEVQSAMNVSNCIEPSCMTAEAQSSLVDGEVLGQDADGGLIQWNATTGAPYNSGETVEQFGISNLSETELKRLNVLNCIERTNLSGYVRVTGEATDPDDEGVQGFYVVELTLARPVVQEALTGSDRTEIAEAVLDEFHNHQGIENLDDFAITVHLDDGTTIEEGDEEVRTGLVLKADIFGKMDESELPFDLL